VAQSNAHPRHEQVLPTMSALTSAHSIAINLAEGHHEENSHSSLEPFLIGGLALGALLLLLFIVTRFNRDR
jgi:hypothetical protein